MASKICVICHKKIGVLKAKAELQDGFVCANCYIASGISVFDNSGTFDANSFNEYTRKQDALLSSFSATKIVEKVLQIDENTKTFKVGLDLFEISNLLSFELLEDGQTVTKGGLGSAIAGGLLFGGVGAVVGGVVGGKKSKGVCTSMKIKITVKNSHTDTVYIDIVNTDTKTGGIVYKAAQQSAQKYLSALQIIADMNKNGSCTPSLPSVDVASELEKFYALMGQGVITEDEFNAKKSQLLGL